MEAKGEFTVKLTPESTSLIGSEATTLGRMSFDKNFIGHLAATSHGEMLSARTSVKTSAGYVAIERVEGSLDGKKGSFVLQHFGIMAKDDDRLVLEIVPDSGEGELAGLIGEMEIRVEKGKHLYSLNYEFETPS